MRLFSKLATFGSVAALAGLAAFHVYTGDLAGASTLIVQAAGLLGVGTVVHATADKVVPPPKK